MTNNSAQQAWEEEATDLYPLYEPDGELNTAYINARILQQRKDYVAKKLAALSTPPVKQQEEVTGEFDKIFASIDIDLQEMRNQARGKTSISSGYVIGMIHTIRKNLQLLGKYSAPQQTDNKKSHE
jgi:hypothetical protein